MVGPGKQEETVPAVVLGEEEEGEEEASALGL